MIPFDPTQPHVAWFHAWRGHIQKAKDNPNERDAYCRAAAVAQTMYLVYVTLEKARQNR